MERLTRKNGCLDSLYRYISRSNFDADRIIKIMRKCAAYEDTGLTPERCAELAKAEQEGRLMEMPCKIGERVYKICDKYEKHYGCCSCTGIVGNDSVCAYWDETKEDCTNLVEMYGDKQIISIRFKHEHIPEHGRTVFLSREEAEKALESEV